MRKSILLLLCSSVFLASCWDWGRKPGEPVSYQKVWGYKPVFSTDTTLLVIGSEAPRTMRNPSKIYVKDNLIFQNDIGYGIHVIDNSNPSQARTIGFIRVNGSSEMSIKGNYMYVNSYNALVVVDITDWQQVREVKRVANAFQQGVQGGGGYQHYYIPPPEHGVYYECSGLIMTPGTIQSGWIRDSIYKYNCYYK